MKSTYMFYITNWIQILRQEATMSFSTCTHYNTIESMKEDRVKEKLRVLACSNSQRGLN